MDVALIGGSSLHRETFSLFAQQHLKRGPTGHPRERNDHGSPEGSGAGPPWPSGLSD